MQIGIRASEEQKSVLLQNGLPDSVEVEWITEASQIKPANIAVFDLFDADEHEPLQKFDDALFFMNAVRTPTANLTANCIRVNGWPGFLNKNCFELAASNKDVKHRAELVLNELGWNYVWVEDTTGMITARIVAMIINEAYYGLQDNISTKEEIDTAMKLGTNYPFGPFEWCEKIGKHKVAQLLSKLAEIDNRYEPAPLLLKEIKNKKY